MFINRDFCGLQDGAGVGTFLLEIRRVKKKKPAPLKAKKRGLERFSLEALFSFCNLNFRFSVDKFE